MLISANIFALLYIAASQTYLPLRLEHFIESQEELVLDVAAYATQLHARRVQHIRTCECSRHSCSNDFLQAPCVTHLGTPSICQAEGRRIDNTTTIFRTPPGTDPSDLSPGLKESICTYRHIQQVAEDYTHDFGWTYLGNYPCVIPLSHSSVQGRATVTLDGTRRRHGVVMSTAEMRC